MMKLNPQPATRALVSDDSLEWQWPIDPQQYDQTPKLSPIEHEALLSLGWNIRRGFRHDTSGPEWISIKRLLDPLDDACCSLFIPERCSHHRCALDAIALILHGSRRTQLAFWGWNPETWVEVIGADYKINQQTFSGWVDGLVRTYLIALAYLVCGFSDFQLLGAFNRIAVAKRVFGPSLVEQAVDQVMTVLRDWGYHSAHKRDIYPGLVCLLLLLNRSPHLSDISTETIKQFRHHKSIHMIQRNSIYAVQRALAALGYVDPPATSNHLPKQIIEGVDSHWQDWVEYWMGTSTLTYNVRITHRTILFKVGRWLAQKHPAIHDPSHWTREICASYVAEVERMCIGDYAQRHAAVGKRIGRPLSAKTKATYITAVRTFFHNCQEWEKIPRRFDASRALATPRSIYALTGPDPRIISDEVWAKLLWAGLHLEANDLCVNPGGQTYPIELIHALTIVWLFAGLRSDEIVRLRVGCIRWQNKELTISKQQSEEKEPKDAICLLDVPIHKTGIAFTKPVDPLVGKAIEAWEAVRPMQPQLRDRRTAELVNFLFCYRAKRVGKVHINCSVIPALCRKAGIPMNDVRGKITSHRARATIATQLYNAKEPMTLFELQAWLGHSSPNTTQQYARITPTTLAKAYTDAGYFSRNVRTIEVLIDRKAVEEGGLTNGTPWQYYDSGHGYCTYSFFEQCPHRMACACCDFYLPKGSTKSQLLEAKDNLQRMLATIPLTEAECAAVEDGTTALDRLLEHLVDIPTPAGQTPRELGGKSLPVLQKGGG